MTEPVTLNRDGAVLVITLNRPESLNALNRDTNRALKAAIDAAARDGDVGAIIVTGAGRAFCAGADLKDVTARYAAGEPNLAAINGTAAGAGLSLALACDLRLAAAGASLIVVFVRVGLVPDAGSLFFLTRMLGLSKATELALTGDAVSVEEAQRLGLVAAIVPAQELMATALERARRLASGPRQTYALIKRGLARAFDLDLEQALELEAQLQTLAARTPDAHEAVAAFIEKRDPVFGKDRTR
jgi:2-(1,2-epoxy-1,2-dihydrophenyl)acetyl-CoA isomerase